MSQECIKFLVLLKGFVPQNDDLTRGETSDITSRGTVQGQRFESLELLFCFVLFCSGFVQIRLSILR